MKRPFLGLYRQSRQGSPSWARRTAELHGEFAAIAKTDLRWWLFAGGAAAAEPWGERGEYVISDATPTADTFLGYREPTPADPIADAIARAIAARTTLRELDGELPGQPLAVTISPAERTRRSNGNGNGNGARNGNGAHDHSSDGAGAIVIPSTLDVAAFAIGKHCVIASLDDPGLAHQLAAAAAGVAPRPWSGATPFVCVSIGDDSIETVRHGHRRAWQAGHGPWLGLGRTHELATVSTCHLVVDGYGHARVTSRIVELMRSPAAVLAGADGLTSLRASANAAIARLDGGHRSNGCALPALAPVAGAMPLAVAWRELPAPSPRLLPLAYALGRVLHRMTGQPGAPFSPTFQIPIAPGERDDPMRIRRRSAYGLVSVRFDNGVAEPYPAFETRAREILAREAAGYGLCTRLLAAARAAPAPLAWKRRSISATRARWLERFAEVIGGRACLSKIRVDSPLPPTCAVSSPARLATANDPLGGCVLTILDNGTHAAITACGSGLAGTPAAANALIDDLFETL